VLRSGLESVTKPEDRARLLGMLRQVLLDSQADLLADGELEPSRSTGPSEVNTGRVALGR
jgi:hypothetical protein